ncbi:Adenine DNA glycosylase [Burkholderiales bacterium]|nr:MAG: A/G-specific adenine glycosylase [Burkholderiales bacterium]CAG0970936.1 Adenine DNA glycosylase [Burkholderiales bacterium]
MSTDAAFAARLLAWQKQHGRQDLPWQGDTDPYRVWVAEVMLQQTQVATVLPYYARFLASFPDLTSLAAAPLETVLAHWAGLGYYRRARNLHDAAKRLATHRQGRMPGDFDGLLALPGVGRSTAAAIAAAAFGERRAILDGNVKRVLARAFAITGFPGAGAVEKVLWRLAESLLPEREVARYHQALMDLGATVCTARRPECAHCPLTETCLAKSQGRVAELPEPRPRRSLPTRECFVAVLRAGRSVLLERRPPCGIWGGLWSLPEFADESALAGYVAALPGTTVLRGEDMPELRHSFTHFRLLLRPRCYELEARPSLAHDSASAWQSIETLAELALPTPVARILRQLPRFP